MSTTGTTYFPLEGNQNYFTLYNEQYLRKLNIGGNWKSLGVGITYSIEATSSIVGGLWLGMGSSNANGGIKGFKDGFASIQRMFGAGFGMTGASSYGTSYNSMSFGSNISGSYLSTPRVYVGVIFGGSFGIIDYATTAYSMTAPSSSESPRKCVGLSLNIYKSGNNQVMQGTFLEKFLGTTDSHVHTNSTLYSKVLQGSLGEVGWVDGVTQNFRWNQFSNDASNPFDYINIFWTGSAPIRIYQVAAGITSPI